MKSVYRTKEMGEKYDMYIEKEGLADGCRLCEKLSIHEFEYWRIVKNNFPYDKIAKTHDMLVPIRHIIEPDFDIAEKEELLKIKGDYLNKHYEFMLEPVRNGKSIPAHFHLHLIVARAYID